MRNPAAGEMGRMPPRERILAAARELFSQHGIRAVGVEAIAEAADTNKMSLYRHFDSKDTLVAEYLRQLGAEADRIWDAIAAAHPGDACSQLRAWLLAVNDSLAGSRGCPLTNAAVELPRKDHPARRVIEEHKRGNRDRLAALCQAVGAADPALLADELLLLIEGARVTSQSVGPSGPGSRFIEMAEALIAGERKL